jgi:hypothetical protein
VTEPNDVVARILAADAGHAAAIVLAMPGEQTRAALAALGPREVSRLLLGARADRVPDLVGNIAADLLPAVLAQLQVVQVAGLVPLLGMEAAVRVVRSLQPAAAAELLLALPTHQRVALQGALPQPPPAQVSDGDYPRRVEEAVRRIAGRTSWLDARAGILVTEIFGRPVQVTARDAPDTSLTSTDLHGLVAAADWRNVSGLVVMTNGPLDYGLGAGVREARARGYLVDVVRWQDNRDDGVLKRALVRLAG